MTTFKTATKPVREVAADLLIVPVFTGSDVGPGLKETGLADAYAAARLTGKKGETLLVTRRRGDKFAAEAVLLVGVGPKEAFDLTTMRRTLAKALAGCPSLSHRRHDVRPRLPGPAGRRRGPGRRRGDRAGLLPLRSLQETGRGPEAGSRDGLGLEPVGREGGGITL